jgi:hypothetical protein
MERTYSLGNFAPFRHTEAGDIGASRADDADFICIERYSPMAFRPIHDDQTRHVDAAAGPIGLIDRAGIAPEGARLHRGIDRRRT